MKKDSLGDRMKRYENVSRFYLTNRSPVIIRIDGKTFHTFTRGFWKPFDPIMVKTMKQTMQYLCKNIENCVLGYTQSDEITLVLCDYKTIDTQPWFDNNILKITSVSASMATAAFNQFFRENVYAKFFNSLKTFDEMAKPYMSSDNYKTALFDSRCFNIPIDEVNNCLVWRQHDAIRNSIQSVAQSFFSHTELMGKNCNELIEMLNHCYSYDWHSIDTDLQRGSCCVKRDYNYLNDNGEPCFRRGWIIDENIPIFHEDPDYVEKRIMFKE